MSQGVPAIEDVLARPPQEIAAEILRSSPYALTVFRADAFDALEFTQQRNRIYLRCLATDRLRPARPEEIVRQLFIHLLMTDYGYPRERIAVEKPVQFGSAVHEKAADIVIADKDDPVASYIIVEVKKPRRADGVDQLIAQLRPSMTEAEGRHCMTTSRGKNDVDVQVHPGKRALTRPPGGDAAG